MAAIGGTCGADDVRGRRGRGPRCGDDILQESFGEECDDGNLTETDTCSATCVVKGPG